MISDERLKEIASAPFGVTVSEVESLAMEMLKKRSCQHHWNELKLVECGGSYQYCTMCGAKKVSE